MTTAPIPLSRKDVQALARSAGLPLPPDRLDAVTAAVNAVREVIAPLREIDFGEFVATDRGSDDAAL